MSSVMIINDTNGQENLFSVDSNTLFQAANIVQPLALDEDNKIVLNLSSQGVLIGEQNEDINASQIISSVENGGDISGLVVADEHTNIDAQSDQNGLVNDGMLVMDNQNIIVYQCIEPEKEKHVNIENESENLIFYDDKIDKYECSIYGCEMSYMCAQQLKEHMSTHTEPNPRKKEFSCTVDGCDWSFDTSYKLNRHLESHFKNSVKQYSCSVDGCEWSFASSSKLNRHMETHLRRKEYACDFQGCTKKFTTTDNLKTHKRIHVRPDIIPCNYCDLKFPTKHRMEMHLKYHSEVDASYKCPFENCDKQYYTTNAMASHLRRHQKSEDELKCSYEGCGKLFTSVCRLKQHVRQHTGERPYSCTFEGCNWSFQTASKLTRHIRKHTGERRHVCPYENCGKAFMRAEHLRGHIITHSDDKPFSCPQKGCSARFTAKSSWYVHIKKHKRKLVDGAIYICPFNDCDKEYSRKEELKVHLQDHLMITNNVIFETVGDTRMVSQTKQTLKSPNNSEKSVKMPILNTIDQFEYFALLSSEEQEVMPLEIPVPTISTSPSEVQAVTINEGSIVSVHDVYPSVNGDMSIIVDQQHVGKSSTDSTVSGTLCATHPVVSSTINAPLISSIPDWSAELESTSRVQQINFSGSARTDFCCTSNPTKNKLTKQEYLDKYSDQRSKSSSGDGSKSRKKWVSSKASRVDNSSISPYATLAPTDVVLTSGAITFRDPTTGTHFVQTQLLQDDPPCVITDIYGEDHILRATGAVTNSSLPSDLTAVPVNLLSDAVSNVDHNIHINHEFTGSTINMQDLV